MICEKRDSFARREKRDPPPTGEKRSPPRKKDGTTTKREEREREMDHTHTSPQEAAHGTGTPGDGLQAQPHSPQEAPHSGTGTPGDGTGDPCLALLNPRQREAVCCTDAPSLVIAGAGSGKTRVLTAKIAWLLSHEGMEPQHIMALTFTNKAALEMKQRVAALVGPGAAARITMGTFHSVLARILRREHQAIGYPADYTIYDTSDSESLLGQVIGGLGLDRKRQYKPQAVLGRISRAKNMLLQPGQYPAALAQADQAAGMPAVGRIWREYQDRLRQAGAMDFDDILVNAWLLLRDHPGAARRYQDLYHYVLVDEYQDTNYAQHQIVLLLTRERQRVCVVGDDAQSIYSFRGAEIDNILHFRDAYPGARLFRLERNYRSTRTIVEAASSLIGHNQGQIPKQVFSLGDQGSPIEVFHTYSDQDEAATLARHLTRLHREERLPYSQMAILYRTNSQSRSLEEELRRRDIPYHIYGGLSFYQRKEVKDAIAYLRLCVNPRDETALRRVINYPARGIGEATLERVWQAAARGGVSPWEVVAAPQGHGLAAAPARRLAAFATLVAQLRESMEAGADAYRLALQALSLSGMQAEVFQGSGLDDLQRQQNLQELTDSIGTFVQERREQGLPAGAADWLQEVSLQGAGVPGRVRGGDGGGPVSQPGGSGQRARPGGGAPPVLCGHDARGPLPGPLLGAQPHALRPHGVLRPQPFPGRDRPPLPACQRPQRARSLPGLPDPVFLPRPGLPPGPAGHVPLRARPAARRSPAGPAARPPHGIPVHAHPGLRVRSGRRVIIGRGGESRTEDSARALRPGHGGACGGRRHGRARHRALRHRRPQAAPAALRAPQGSLKGRGRGFFFGGGEEIFLGSFTRLPEAIKWGL